MPAAELGASVQALEKAGIQRIDCGLFADEARKIGHLLDQ
jgi:hypothetical protein